MTGPGTGRGKTDPFRIEPDLGQVCENGSKCPHSRFSTGVSQAPRARFHVAIGSLTEQLLHVLDDHQRWPQRSYRPGDMKPQATPVAFAQPGPPAGARDVLARKTSSQHVDRLDLGPVNGGDVAQVRHQREAMSQDLRRSLIDVGDPCELAAEHFSHRGIESPVAGAE